MDCTGHICGADRDNFVSHYFLNKQFGTAIMRILIKHKIKTFIDGMDSRCVDEVPSAIFGAKTLGSAGMVVDIVLKKARRENWDLICFTLWMQGMRQYEGQQRKQDGCKQSGCKQSAPSLLLETSQNVTGHTRRYFVKRVFNNLLHWIVVASSRKKINDVTSLLASRGWKRETGGGMQARKARLLMANLLTESQMEKVCQWKRSFLNES